MKAKDFIYILFGVIILLVLWLFLDELNKGKRKDALIARLTQENQQLKAGYLSLFEKYLNSINSAEPSTVKELQRLKCEIDYLDTSTHIELDSVIRHVDKNEGAKAVKDLAKIVENQLREKVKNDKSFSKKPMLNNLLEHAHQSNLINEQMLSFGKYLKDIRNKESHELGVQIPSHLLGIAIFSGIEIIYALKRSSLPIAGVIA
ncbi:MAG: hypothetical protein JNL22_14120 [Bacteroidales bacterium]|nr:hypothetical protein [Bacteroidales bacterium]